jgi:hypothetical protein
MVAGPVRVSRAVRAVLSDDDGDLVFRQGTLRVLRQGRVLVVRCGDVARVVIDDDDTLDSVLLAALVDDDPAALVMLDAVALVVARAILERRRGRFHVHGGLVVDDGRGTLIAGPGGAGKTTTTLALMAAGARLAGDDVAFIDVLQDVVQVVALRRPLHVGAATAAMFAGLLPAPRPNETSLMGKRVVDVAVEAAGADADSPSSGVPVGRLVFPAIADVATTTARRLSAAEVLPRLLEASAMVGWRHVAGAQAHLDALGRLARVEAVAVVLGRDALTRPAAITDAIRSAV